MVWTTTDEWAGTRAGKMDGTTAGERAGKMVGTTAGEWAGTRAGKMPAISLCFAEVVTEKAAMMGSVLRNKR